MKIIAGLMIVLALVTGILPLFTDCQSQGRALTLADGRTIPMKCHWTGMAEIALAVPLFVTGMLLATSKRKETLRTLAVLGGVLGVFVILLPTVLIGVCANPDMVCNSIMKPSLILGGSGLVALSLVGLVQTLGKKEAVA
jgi:hypothetical protein